MHYLKSIMYLKRSGADLQHVSRVNLIVSLQILRINRYHLPTLRMLLENLFGLLKCIERDYLRG